MRFYRLTLDPHLSSPMTSLACWRSIPLRRRCGLAARPEGRRISLRRPCGLATRPFREKKRTACGAKPLADNQADLEEAVLARVRGRVAVGENVFLLLAGEGGRGATG
jgi:hypothetical protein